MARRKPLAGYTVFVDGVDYVGVATGFTPPTIAAGDGAVQHARAWGGVRDPDRPPR